jgi:ADP-heptose:LPS heptosyltransferase
MSVPQNILLIRLKSIGDVILTLPAVHAVRENFPSAKITYLTSKEIAPLLEGFREVNEIIPLNRSTLRSYNLIRKAGEFFRLIGQLRAGKFSLVIDLQGYGETAWLTRITGAPQRWGSVYGKGRKWAYTIGVVRDNKLHHADRSLAILQTGGLAVASRQNRFNLPATAAAAAQDFFRANRLDEKCPTLFLQPFTSSPQKNWPLENYLAVARHWQTQGGQIIFGGGPSDRAQLDAVLAGQFITSAGVPLLVTGGLMQLSTLVLGGDTGALHLAVALGCRVVMIMNSAASDTSIPFQHPEWAIRTPANGSAKDVELSAVIEACESPPK